MGRDTVTFDVARSIGLQLPGVSATAGARMALKIKGRILACEAIHKSAEPGSLMVSIGREQRDAVLAQHPEACYLTKHYLPHPVVLVRLGQISRTDLSALMGQAWEFVWSEVQ
jgi:hypothetical protein